ncbi:hypothetical protein [Pareuzebyella sediminis]|uniref:hypothetical protein n=1 Tax=Pareuzebyella sediminis TaxID=2607998 RepID=UPI0011EBC263|nr:hypothetical protein [Pareuzebyella sediminis]
MKVHFLISFCSCICFLGQANVFQTGQKSSIEIISPNASTIWNIPGPAKIEWKTSNIDPAKNIRFFLARNDMVVQELGTFVNNSVANGIKLAKNIGSGDAYQVVGIELFPDNKFQVAKFATPYFSIRNAASDARKAQRNGNVYPQNTESVSPTREVFEGRKISYTKELTFASKNLKVAIWDHGRQDGDIVSIYLNGETIIAKHSLTYRKKKIAIELDPDKSNDLFLYAHNLGNSPPNTVSIEITDGNSSENMILNSDLKSCEAVLINVKK